MKLEHVINCNQLSWCIFGWWYKYIYSRPRPPHHKICTNKKEKNTSVWLKNSSISDPDSHPDTDSHPDPDPLGSAPFAWIRIRTLVTDPDPINVFWYHTQNYITKLKLKWNLPTYDRWKLKRIRIRGSGSAQHCRGSTTLKDSLILKQFAAHMYPLQKVN